MNVGWIVGASLLAAVFAGEQSLSLTAPTVVLEIRGAQIKGDPLQLAWSPDGTMLCLQTLEGSSPGKNHAYAIVLEKKSLQGLDVAPDWAGKYWDWKSAR